LSALKAVRGLARMKRMLADEKPAAACGWVLALLLAAHLAIAAVARGQSTTSDPVPAAPRPSIPPPKRFGPKDPAARLIGRESVTSVAGSQDGTAASSLPTISPLPDASISPRSTDRRDNSPDGASNSTAMPPPPPRLPIDTTLIPGRIVEPIDLANALKLNGVRNLDIVITRQQILAAIADLSSARALWLPSLFYGPSWYRSDGQIQTVTGQVQPISRSALFLGGTAALNNTIQGPPPGTGIPSVNGSTATLRISDAIFEPMAARRILAANQAALRTATNDTMLEVAEAYFDLQGATGRLAIAREAAANAEALAAITNAYARTGQGLEADHRRALTEVKHRRRETHLASGQLLVASANLIRLLVLDPNIVMAPVEPPECIIHLIPDDIPLDNLLSRGMQDRPELASAQDRVAAAAVRQRQARLRPFIPSVFMTYAGGGLGGGANAFFGDFGARGDAEVGLFWELQNLGFTDVAIMRRRAAELEISNLEKIRTQTRVGADVVAAYETRQAASRQIEDARETVVEALDSLKLNFVNIRQGAQLPGATRPIEVLQPIQALAQGRLDYLDSVLSYNRAQFQLKRAIGQQPLISPDP
jgi:outer membrane protein TolC